jgi:hypothetical protein
MPARMAGMNRLLDGREIGVQQHHDPVRVRLDGGGRGDRHGAAGGR